MKKNKIVTFYDNQMVLDGDIDGNYSKSPLKPKKLIEYLDEKNLINYFDIKSFEPFHESDFLIAHTEEYVDSFFKGIKPLCESNGLKWTTQFATSVRYTNASLYHAIKHSILNPTEIGFSPTSGFHHATPSEGSGFCTFSGQVIASVKLYREFGVRGVYVDLDGHFGNSIEDSRNFVPDLNNAIAKNHNINIESYEHDYVFYLKEELKILKESIFDGKVDYIVFCHGADSHYLDDIGGGCSTPQWTDCSKVFYNFIKEVEDKIKKPFPLSLSLFGGYRRDHFKSVLSLHTSDLVDCLNILCDEKIDYKLEIKEDKIKFKSSKN